MRPLYACNTADPPWAEYGGGGRGAQNHYGLMSLSDIAKTIIRSPAWNPAPDAHLWVWVTDNFLLDGLSLIDQLGFRYVRTFCWVKTAETAEDAELLDESDLQQGIGQYARGSHEICLFSVAGKSMIPAAAMRPKSVIFAPRQEHSRKPDKAYERWFERVSPGPRLEMFARRGRSGWDSWGNEVD